MSKIKLFFFTLFICVAGFYIFILFAILNFIGSIKNLEKNKEKEEADECLEMD